MFIQSLVAWQETHRKVLQPTLTMKLNMEGREGRALELVSCACAAEKQLEGKAGRRQRDFCSQDDKVLFEISTLKVLTA